MDDFEIELKQGFLEEAAQSIADVEQCFLSLESNPNDEENLNKIFRLAHNLKGSSKAVGFDQMGALTHEFETFILKIKKGDIPASPDAVNLLLRTNDFIGKMVEGLKADLTTSFDVSALAEELSKAEFKTPETIPDEPAPQEIAESVPEENQAVEEIVEEVVEVATSTVEVETSPVRLETIPVEQPPPVGAAPVNEPPSSAGSPPQSSSKAISDESIRVSVGKVESLLNSIGEMVILQSVMKEQAMATQSLIMKKTLHQLEKVTKEIQDISMSLRMVPVKPTFQKMQRIVRDTAQALKKDVGIHLVGEETELDKTVLEKINDPLVHLIRNSVDHGIETADIRIRQGKPARGQVKLSAFHKGGKLLIEVSDDGGGLDPEKLTKKAIEKGVLKAGTKLSEKDAYNLIFAPGFSTKEAVTDVSGRGVGMDVVRTNILDLSGEINIFSTLGKGTTFQIVLPLTLAIIEGMVLTFAGDRYVIPFSHVHETLRPEPKFIQKSTDLGYVLMLRDENIPIFKLGDFLGKKNKLNPEDMIAMVVRTGPKPFALLVDDVLGHSQVVVKQLGPELSHFKGASGCTILGDGKPALILEPMDLVKRPMTLMQRIEPQTGGKAA